MVSRGRWCVPCVYGDVGNPDFLAHLDLANVRLVISTIPDQEATRYLIARVKAANPHAEVFVTSYRIDDAPISLGQLCADGTQLRPDIVWFGEALDPKVLEESARAMLESEVFLVIGTSALVQPAASIAFEAVRRGIPVVEVNRERTPLSKLASATLLGKAGELLPKLLKA